jgi:predicted metal-dependent peptidase
MTQHSNAHSRRARAALAQLPEVDPAIAALALWCQHRDADGATRTASDTILYGPRFEALPIQEQIGVAAHHVLHVALRHSARAADMALRLGDGFDAALYNLAADAVINEVLLEGGHALPRPAVRAAELVAQLPGAKPEAVLAEWDTDRLFLALVSTQNGPSQARDAAEGYAKRQVFEPDLEGGTPSGAAEEDGPDSWAARLEQALDAGRAAGSGIGPVLARFADLPQARVPWEVQLRGLLAKATSQVPRLSHKRPASRFLAREALARHHVGPTPAFEPGQARDQRRSRVVVGLDTSSSITAVQLALFASEALSIARKSGAELHLLAFDETVHARVNVRQTGDITGLEPRTGGGTDYAPVLAEARALDPSVLVMLTDLDAPLGPAPRHKVIWATPSAPASDPPFGTLLVMDR